LVATIDFLLEVGHAKSCVPQDLQPEHGQDQLQLHAQPQAENRWSQQINLRENDRTTNFESMQLPKTS